MLNTLVLLISKCAPTILDPFQYYQDGSHTHSFKNNQHTWMEYLADLQCLEVF